MTALVEVKGLDKAFGGVHAVEGVSFAVEAGQVYSVIGPNGAGKTTLFNLITARFAPTAGTVKLHGEDLAGLEPYQINRKGLSRSFQITNIFPAMSVFENVRCALLWSQGYKYSFWHLVNRKHDLTDEAEKILDQINLLGRRNLPAGTLSYAEQRALEIGITIAGGADVIMLDEPTAGMSNTCLLYTSDAADE